MSGVATLQAELANLVAQSKKRNQPLRDASERSLRLLETVISSESQDSDAALHKLESNPDFIEPFLLACTSSNAKACASALQCLQILASSRAINPNRLHDLLKALMEATQLGIAIQLKILQLLPVLFQNCSGALRGPLAAELLQVSAELLDENKTAMVHNAAYATLQQLITAIFDRIDTSRRLDPPPVADKTVHLSSNTSIRPKSDNETTNAVPTTFEVDVDVHDGAMILLDFCDLAEDLEPRFLRFSNLPISFTLELLELTLTNHARLFETEPVFRAILRQRITPLLIRLFSETVDFAITLRTVRTFYLLLRQHIIIVHVEAEVILSMLGDMTIKPPMWRRVLCLEVFQGLFSEFRLVVEMVSKYPSLRPVLQSIVDSFSKSLVNNENNLIMATTIAMQESAEKDKDDAASAARADSPAVSSNGSSANGAQPELTGGNTSNKQQSPLILRQSAVKVPFIDLLDKSEPPRASYNYFFYLVLVCINAISEGISRFTVKSPNEERSVEMNNTLEDVLADFDEPLMNCYTIFMGAAMEIELYKSVVRSVQRVAHTAGILGLDKTRDDYMKLLVQFSQLMLDAHMRSALLTRNILCIRALFNLGYALGNKLEFAWSIIVDCIGSLSTQLEVGFSSTVDHILSERDAYKPIEGALHRLIDTTADLDDEALYFLIASLGRRDSLKAVFLVILEALARINADRLAVYPSQCWDLMQTLLLEHIKDKSLQPEMRTLAAEVLNDAIFSTMESVSTDETYKSILSSIANQIESSQGQDTLDFEIQLGAVRSLNRLLDQFGSRITAGWESIFGIFSSVLDRTAAQVSEPRKVEIIKASFHALELICTDFLEHLPDSCVFELIISLDKFATQSSDINTAFTAISLFWTVCDHLMKDVPKIRSFPGVQSETDLVRLSQGNTPNKHYALWMLALIKLASIANEPQHQIKTGAVQIFFRLFESHDKLLPSSVWNVCQTLVLVQIMAVVPDKDPKDANETISLIVNGLGKLYTTHLGVLTEQPGFGKAWKALVDFFSRSVEVSSSVALVVYTSFELMLRKAIEIKSERAKNQVWDFWVNQNAAPKLSEDRPKVTVQALQTLVGIYPSLALFVNPTISMQQAAISLIYRAALYPHPGEVSSKSSISPLQDLCMDELLAFDQTPREITNAVMEKLTGLALMAVTENDGPPGMFDAMGIRALKSIDSVVDIVSGRMSENLEERLQSVQEESSAAFLKTIGGTLVAMVIIMRKGERKLAISVFLKFLKLGPYFKVTVADQHIINGSRALMEGSQVHTSDSQTDDMEALTDFFEVITSSQHVVNPGVWPTVLETLATNSLLYERGMFKRTFFTEKTFPVSLDRPPFYGTIEPPRPSSRQDMAYHCLSILIKLATREEPYSQLASQLHERRSKMVLYQYLGDAQVRDRQPMYSLLRSELLYILEQLIEYGASSDLRLLMTRCMSITDHTVATLIQQVLLT